MLYNLVEKNDKDILELGHIIPNMGHFRIFKKSYILNFINVY